MEETDLKLKDEEVAVLVQNGSREKFGILVERYQKKLIRYGYRFLSEGSHIEDIVQDVFISAYQNIMSFNPSLSFSSWIYRIAHNAFINELKKRSHNPFVYVDFDTIIPHPIYEAKDFEKEQKELQAIIERGLDKLSAKYREILILHYLEELSYREISDILHIPIGTVGIRLKRAKESLRKIYKELDINYGNTG